MLLRFDQTFRFSEKKLKHIHLYMTTKNKKKRELLIVYETSLPALHEPYEWGLLQTKAYQWTGGLLVNLFYHIRPVKQSFAKNKSNKLLALLNKQNIKVWRHCYLTGTVTAGNPRKFPAIEYLTSAAERIHSYHFHLCWNFNIIELLKKLFVSVYNFIPNLLKVSFSIFIYLLVFNPDLFITRC